MGGRDPKINIHINFTIVFGGFFDGSLKKGQGINEIDKPELASSPNPVTNVLSALN